jgi:Flp pilus assembly protein TadG
MGPREDQRGDYAIFIAVIASALLMFGGIAYDAPRLITARQHAVHNANEAARVAAATVAAGGTLDQARDAADRRMAATPPLYGAPTVIARMECVGNLVEITVQTSYTNRSALAVFRNEQPIIATGAAEAELVGPFGEPIAFGYLPECPLLVR